MEGGRGGLPEDSSTVVQVTRVGAGIVGLVLGGPAVTGVAPLEVVLGREVLPLLGLLNAAVDSGFCVTAGRIWEVVPSRELSSMGGTASISGVPCSAGILQQLPK